jgi:hypothetical protein
MRFQTQAIIQEVRLQMRGKDDPSNSRADRVEETIELIAQQLDDCLARSGGAPTVDAAEVAS